MPNQKARQLMIENFQDSLRLVRHLMEFKVEEFAEAIGVTRQTVNDLETKKTKMSPTQYIAVAALTDKYFEQNSERFSALKAILDSDGKNYGAEYETAFRDNSLLKCWFEDFIEYEEYDEDDEDDERSCESDELWDLVRDYKIILDAEILTKKHAEVFTEDLTEVLSETGEKIIVPLRSIEKLQVEKTEEEFRQAMNLIGQMREYEVLQVRGEETDPDFHDTILSVFKRFHGTYRLCLITSDEQLAQEVLQLNDSAETGDFEIAAGFVNMSKFKFYAKQILKEEKTESKSEESESNLSEDKFVDWSEL